MASLSSDNSSKRFNHEREEKDDGSDIRAEWGFYILFFVIGKFCKCINHKFVSIQIILKYSKDRYKQSAMAVLYIFSHQEILTALKIKFLRVKICLGSNLWDITLAFCWL